MARSDGKLPSAFQRIGWSNLSAQLSEQIAVAAAPLVAVLAFAASPAQTGWLQTAQTLPFLLLSLPAGLLVDRASRRTLMASAEALRAGSLVAIWLLLTAGALDLGLLAALGFIGAIGTVAYSVAAPALVPMLVARAQLADANRWLELARSSAYAAGPPLGGALVAWTGASTAFVLATGLSLLAVLLLAGLPRDPAPQRTRNLVGDIEEGATFIARHAFLRPILITAVFFNTGWFVLQAIYVAYAIQTLGFSAAQVGVTLGIYGAGMIVGALVAPVVARRVTFGALVLVGPASGFGAALLMLLTLWHPSLGLVGASFFLFGFGPILWTISTMTLRQAVTPNDMLGRVSAFIMTATFGARPAGAALGAIVAAHFGVPACLAVAVACFLLQLVIIATSPVSRLRTLPDAI